MQTNCLDLNTAYCECSALPDSSQDVAGSIGGAGMSSAERAKVEKKLKDLERKLELYKKQDASQRTEVCVPLLRHNSDTPPFRL